MDAAPFLPLHNQQLPKRMPRSAIRESRLLQHIGNGFIFLPLVLFTLLVLVVVTPPAARWILIQVLPATS
jgi:hypothetical protein